MALDIEEKTEQPTARRRREAREQGLGPRSPDLSVASRLVGVAAALQFCGSNLLLEISRYLTERIQRPVESQLTPASFVSQSWEACGQIGVSCAGFVGCVWAGALAAHLLQVGFRFRLADLRPDSSRINPVNGFGKLVRFENVRQAIWGMVKFGAVVALGGWMIWSKLDQLSALTDYDLATSAQFVGGEILLIAWQLAAMFLAFGLADYGYQFWKFEQSLKMTPAEIREELRNDSGNPQWKQQRRRS